MVNQGRTLKRRIGFVHGAANAACTRIRRRVFSFAYDGVSHTCCVATVSFRSRSLQSITFRYHIIYYGPGPHWGTVRKKMSPGLQDRLAKNGFFFWPPFFQYNKRLLRQKTGGACLYMPQDGH